MSPLENKLSFKIFGLVYSFEYDFKCHYNTIAPVHLMPFFIKICKTTNFMMGFKKKKHLKSKFDSRFFI